MNRRQILTATLPAAMAAAYVAGAQAAGAEPASAGNVTPIMALFSEWLALSEACEAAGRKLPETPEGDAIFEGLLAKLGNIEATLMETPCQTAQDFVAKITAWTGYGLHTLPDEAQDAGLWAEARALVAA